MAPLSPRNSTPRGISGFPASNVSGTAGRRPPSYHFSDSAGWLPRAANLYSPRQPCGPISSIIVPAGKNSTLAGAARSNAQQDESSSWQRSEERRVGKAGSRGGRPDREANEAVR